jgi:dUTPase
LQGYSGTPPASKRMPCSVETFTPAACVFSLLKIHLASCTHIIKGAQIIDVDYEGQIHINLFNPTSNSVLIKPGEKIVQFVPYFMPNMFESKEYFSKEELYKNSESIRGDGGFGSSGI